jgi:hypothetical protein
MGLLPRDEAASLSAQLGWTPPKDVDLKKVKIEVQQGSE